MICFAAGTPVLMADGSTKPIETVHVGDELRCDRDPATTSGAASAKVLSVSRRKIGRVLDLEVEAGSGYGTITTTPDHLFYSKSHGAYVRAADLQIGDALLSESGNSCTIQAKSVRDGEFEVYNVELDQVRNFYVATTRAGSFILVHNQCKWPGWTFYNTRRAAKRAAFRRAGIGKVGAAEEVWERSSTTGVWRKGWRNPGNDLVVWEDAGGHVFWDAALDQRIWEPPHFQIGKYGLTPGPGPRKEWFSW